MGVGSSTANKLDKALASDLPEDERYFGLENFGNTCYCNSVLQALYFCEPFRRHVLDFDRERRGDPAYKPVADQDPHEDAKSNDAANSRPLSAVSSSPGPATEPENMLTALTDLFSQIASQRKRTGSVPPKSFINRLRHENDLFSSYMHQDAHEFLNFILNDVADILQREAVERERRRLGLPPRQLNQARVFSNSNLVSMNDNVNNGAADTDGITARSDEATVPGEMRSRRTFVHDLFEGALSNEVRCLCCETVTQRTESFLDLSVDIEQNSSITSCLRNFSSTEVLRKEDKFYCDACCTLQEAERRMRIKRLPRILALHLKRFKYIEQIGRYKKLSYRVVFPLELRLFITSDDAEDPDRLYSLFAVVVHVGSGPNHGHYVSLIKSHGHWLLFDDDCVEPKDESEIQSVFGVTQDVASSTEAGYILFYSAVSE